MAVKTAAVIFSLFLLGLVPCLSYGQQVAVQQFVNMETSGKVAQIDALSGKIAVAVDNGVKLFLVNEKTKLTRGIKTISLSDIKIGDPVIIVYYVDKEGYLWAVTIADSNLEGG